MVRVHNQHGAPAGPVATRHKTLTDRRKPSYKVVLEQVTQEKRKLITVVCGSVAGAVGPCVGSLTSVTISGIIPSKTTTRLYVHTRWGSSNYQSMQTSSKAGWSQGIYRIGNTCQHHQLKSRIH